MGLAVLRELELMLVKQGAICGGEGTVRAQVDGAMQMKFAARPEESTAARGEVFRAGAFGKAPLMRPLEEHIRSIAGAMHGSLRSGGRRNRLQTASERTFYVNRVGFRVAKKVHGNVEPAKPQLRQST